MELLGRALALGLAVALATGLAVAQEKPDEGRPALAVDWRYTSDGHYDQGTTRLEIEAEVSITIELEGELAGLGPRELCACTRWRRAIDEEGTLHQGLEFVQPLDAEAARKLSDLVYRLSL